MNQSMVAGGAFPFTGLDGQEWTISDNPRPRRAVTTS